MDKSPEINKNGNHIEREFWNIDRYILDNGRCSTSNGWLQFDTDQDAHYFGVWVHKDKQQIVTYAEGDITTVTCPDVKSFNAEIEHMCQFYGKAPAFSTIDNDGTCTRYYQDREEFKKSPEAEQQPGLWDRMPRGHGERER